MSFFIRNKRSSNSTGSSLPAKLSQRAAPGPVPGRGGGRGRGQPGFRGRNQSQHRGRGRGAKRTDNHNARLDSKTSRKRKQPDDEEITSEEDELSEGEQAQSQVASHDDEFEIQQDPDIMETPQETRIRLAKEQIREVKRRLRERKKKARGAEEDDQDEQEDSSENETGSDGEQSQSLNDLTAKVLREREMVEGGKALRPIAFPGLDSAPVRIWTLARGGKVLKSPITCVHVPTPTTTLITTKSGFLLECTEQTQTPTDKNQTPEIRKRSVRLPNPPALCVVASTASGSTSTPTSISLIAVSTSQDIRLLSPTTLDVLKVLGGGARGSSWLCVAGQSLFSAHRDRTVKVWDLGEMAYVESLFGHQDAVSFVDCCGGSGGGGSTAQPFLVSAGGFDRTARVWKLAEDSHLVFNCVAGSTAPAEKAQESNSSTQEDAIVAVDSVRALGAGLFVTATCSGSLSLFWVGRKRPLHTVPRAHGTYPPPIGTTGEVSAAEAERLAVPRWITALGSTGDLLGSGSDDGVVKLWRVGSAGAGFGAKGRRLELLRVIGMGSGVVVSLDIRGVGVQDEEDIRDGAGAVPPGLRLVVGVSPEMRNGRWGGRVGGLNCSSVVVVEVGKDS